MDLNIPRLGYAAAASPVTALLLLCTASITLLQCLNATLTGMYCLHRSINDKITALRNSLGARTKCPKREKTEPWVERLRLRDTERHQETLGDTERY